MDRMPFVIYKLTSSSLYAITSPIYLSSHQEPSWGCTATSIGFARVRPGTKYPPTKHPADHHFEWARGRVLQSYQILFISEGAGLFESEYTRDPQVVACGTVFILFPGVWHRYAPDSAVGWTEHWLECQGPAFGEALRTGIVQPKQPLLHTGLEPDPYAALSAATHTRGSGRTGEPAPHIDDGYSPSLGNWLPAKRSAFRSANR
jgi:hypothetical protein